MKNILLFIITIHYSLLINGQTTVTWIGNVDSNWNEVTNWDTVTLPVAGDTIIIGNGTNQPVINDATTLVVYETIIVNNSAVLTLNGTLPYTVETNSNVTIREGGTISVENSQSILKSGERFLIFGTLNNYGTSESLSYSTVYSTGVLNNYNIVTCNNGTSNKNLSNFGEINNYDGSTLNLNIIQRTITPLIFSATNITINGDLTNGKTSSDIGVININEDLTVTGSIDNIMGSTINLATDKNLSADIINNTEGTFNIIGNNTITCYDFINSDTLNLPISTVTFTGNLTNNSSIPIEVITGSTVNINGLVKNFEKILLGSNSTLTLDVDLINNGEIGFEDGSTINSGVINNSTGTFSFPIGGSCTITEQLSNRGGTISFPSTTNLVTIGKVNNNDAGTITINAGAKVKITGISGKSIYNVGTFIIESTGLTSNDTGQLITEEEVSGSPVLPNKFVVERWIDDSTTKWQLVSSPVYTETSDVFKGHFLNYYDTAPGNFVAVTALDQTINRAEGYVVKFDGTQVGIPGMPNPIEFNSKFNHGDKTKNLQTGVGNTYFDLPAGFNLVGNPFPSNLDWDLVYAANSGIDATYYYYVDSGNGVGSGDNSSGGVGVNGWQTYTNGAGGVNENISIGQGFGVVITGNTANTSLNIPNNARTFEASNGFNKKQSEKSNYFELDAISNNIIDKIYFKLNENATENFDGRYDAYKLNSFGYSPTPSFVSADGKKLSVCETPILESINMGFVMNGDGEVVFSIKDFADFSEIILEDKHEGSFTNLINEDYTFQYYESDEEFGRFTLHFNRMALIDNEEIIQDLSIYTNKSTLYIKSAKDLENVKVILYNINGQLVYANRYSDLKEKEITTNLNTGIYILKVSSNKGTTTQKISF